MGGNLKPIQKRLVVEFSVPGLESVLIRWYRSSGVPGGGPERCAAFWNRGSPRAAETEID